MTEPCPRNCGKPSKPRHTCIEPERIAVNIEHHNAALDACHYATVTSEPSPSEERAIGALRSGLQMGRLAVVDAEAVAELRRKSEHYRLQREEGDERIAALEDVLVALAQAARFALDCEEKNFPDEHCRISAEHRSMLEANLDEVRRLLL